MATQRTASVLSRGDIDTYFRVDPAPVAGKRTGAGFDVEQDIMAATPEYPTWHGAQNHVQTSDVDALASMSASPQVARNSILADRLAEASRLDRWTIEMRPLASVGMSGALSLVPGYALHKSDTGHVLGLVSGRYEPLQPATLVGMARQVADGLGGSMAAAGSFCNGRDTWAVVELQTRLGAMFQGTDRETLSYALIHSPNDGHGAPSVRLTHTAVCCRNTLTIGLAGQALAQGIHTANGLARFQSSVEAVMEIATREREILSRLANTAGAELVGYRYNTAALALAYAGRKTSVNSDGTPSIRNPDSIERAYLDAVGAEENRIHAGTPLAWAILQVVTHAERTLAQNRSKSRAGAVASSMLGTAADKSAATVAELLRAMNCGESITDRAAAILAARSES